MSEIMTKREYGEWRADRVNRRRTTKAEDQVHVTVEALAASLVHAFTYDLAVLDKFAEDVPQDRIVGCGKCKTIVSLRDDKGWLG